MSPESCRILLEESGCCVVAPTYNNASTVGRVLMDVSQYAAHIIVVDDGSSDNTASELARLNETISAFTNGSTRLDIIRLPKNLGKGNAIQKGFEQASASNYRYVITIDTDGQHFADDIPVFAAMIARYPGSMIVGARNMQQDGIPGKSSFGNRFSNFWYKLETGVTLPDTQSGFRLYPVGRMKHMHFHTSRFEFEIESLVRVAWAKIPVRWVPVKVYYAPEETRISHFRPFHDFARISLLNTVLVLVTFLWIKPHNIFRRLRWRSLKRFFRREFSRQTQSPVRIASSAGFGVFIGIVPIWGYQLIVGLTLAHFMKLNKTLVFLTANISIPPMIPVILYISFLVGGWITGTQTASATINTISLEFVKLNFYQYFVGSIVFAIVAGAIVFLVTWIAVGLSRKKTKS